MEDSCKTSLPPLEDVLSKIGRGEFSELSHEEELVFYREILSRVKAHFYINQVENVDDFTTARMVWFNQSAKDFLGLSIPEAYAKGFQVLLDANHPEDLLVSKDSTDFHAMRKGDSYSGLLRQISWEKKSSWYYGRCMVLSEKEGRPWQFLNLSVDIQEELQTQKQLLEMQQENARLRTALVLKGLSRREKEVVHWITQGFTDKDVADKLHLSVYTVRTHHRNVLQKFGLKKTAELICLVFQARQY